MNIHN